MSVVRQAGPADAPAVRTVLARAYHDNPLMRWVLPDERTRDDACAAWLGPSVDRYVALGGVDVLVEDDEVVAAAAWREPGLDAQHPVLRTLPTGPGVLAALVGPERAADVLARLGAAAAWAPAVPAPYLNYLAVRPEQQGAGLGARLLEHRLRRYDAVGVPTWLGTTDPRNVPFYARLGFAVVGEVELTPSSGDRAVPGDRTAATVLRVLHRGPADPLA
ncbi:GNAT family N-acetyltransferase [Cellulomonas sp.]|uniref:GNAT family N-acetyltransferase n=1 Tax=Cellulomonas sp. TaxID=40001 RepID=UPI002584AD9F|nr:GNAT family N-acetyltransferase [Cellulomonas sp.]MCR6690466.1 GNAT family N-acetyltransferase [Cellulomonas sp.]